MKLKICGQNDVRFAAAAARRGVDYLGFVFHPASPRHVSVEMAAAIAEALSRLPVARPQLVGVFVKQTVDEIVDIMRRAGLDVVQLHRRAAADDVAALKSAGFEVWTLAGGAPGDGVIFDSSHGDGETDFHPGNYLSILAGRIGIGNLAEALVLAPDVLDVNSGLERVPGVKDEGLLTAFIDRYDALRQARS